MKWRPYPAYKDSGIVWLDRIPTHWKITRIKHLASSDYKSFIDGDWIESPYITDVGIRLVQTGNIGVGQYREQGYRYISEETFNKLVCTEVIPGDVLICRLAAPVGRACVAPDLGVRMITSVDVCILKPQSNHNPRYIVYFLSSEAYLHWIKSLSRGSTRARISRSMLGDIAFVAPPLSEQHTIAAFLDRKTAHIDALIAKKERQIELLQEKRAALISHAVTQGLDPDVPMKDSGIEWLGEIPAHWEAFPLKFAVLQKPNAIKTGPFGSQLLSSEMMDSEVKVYNQRNVIDQNLAQGDNYISREKYEELRAFTVYPGDVLVTTRGTIGRCVIVSDDAELGVLHPCLMRVQPDPRRLLTRFLILLVQDSFLVQTQLFLMSNATTIEVIYSGNLREAIVPIPPVTEQHTIIAYLDHETAKLDTLTAKVQESIKRLQEYRTALISAAVTGKIDVRCNALQKCVAPDA